MWTVAVTLLLPPVKRQSMTCSWLPQWRSGLVAPATAAASAVSRGRVDMEFSDEPFDQLAIARSLSMRFTNVPTF